MCCQPLSYHSKSLREMLRSSSGLWVSSGVLERRIKRLALRQSPACSDILYVFFYPKCKRPFQFISVLYNENVFFCVCARFTLGQSQPVTYVVNKPSILPRLFWTATARSRRNIDCNNSIHTFVAGWKLECKSWWKQQPRWMLTPDGLDKILMLFVISFSYPVWVNLSVVRKVYIATNFSQTSIESVNIQVFHTIHHCVVSHVKVKRNVPHLWARMHKSCFSWRSHILIIFRLRRAATHG